MPLQDLTLPPELAKACPVCKDEAVHQVLGAADDIYWCALGWPDPDRFPCDEVTFDFCPWCGNHLPVEAG
jgi:hypothetical protein